MVRRVYWDACAFLGLLNKEADKHANCLAVWREAEQGKTVIFTSFFTFAEVYKAKCEGKARPLDEQADKNIESSLQQSFIEGVLVDETMGINARRMMRRHEACKKPSDGIHLASAIRLGVDETGKVLSVDGRFLTICKVRPIPPPPPPPAPLLELLDPKGDDGSGEG